MSKVILNREDKIQQLLSEGRVRLYPGHGYAEIVGSNGATYRITKRDGCNCPNSLSRDPRSCYHAAACRALCEEYRSLAAQARNGETVRPSVALLKALGWQVGASAPAPAPMTRERLIEIYDAFDAAGYFDPNTPLPDGRVRRTAANPDGYCLRCGSTQHARCAARVRRLNEDLFGTAA